MQESHLAPARLITLKTVSERTGLDYATIWKFIKVGAFPKPHLIAQGRAWSAEDVETWLRNWIPKAERTFRHF